ERWMGTGEPGARFLEEAHPYAPDLDLFGKGSLFELLCTTRTGIGEATLADWLRNAAAPDEIHARQDAVSELRPAVDLREELALLGADIPSSVNLEGLSHWAVAPRILYDGLARAVAFALAIATPLALFLWLFDAVNRWPFFMLVLVEAA